MPRSCFLNSLLQDLSSWEDRHLLLLDWDHCPLGAQLCSQNLPIGSGGFGQAAPCWAMRSWLGRIGICHEVRRGSPSPEGPEGESILAQHPRVRRLWLSINNCINSIKRHAVFLERAGLEMLQGSWNFNLHPATLQESMSIEYSFAPYA